MSHRGLPSRPSTVGHSLPDCDWISLWPVLAMAAYDARADARDAPMEGNVMRRYWAWVSVGLVSTLWSCGYADKGSGVGNSAKESSATKFEVSQQGLLAGLSSKLAVGRVRAVGNDAWRTVSLQDAYEEMVVIATPIYDSGNSPPLIARVDAAEGSSFQLRIDRFDGSYDVITPIDVQYLVMEAGAYSAQQDGIQAEAVIYDSSRTDNARSFYGKRQSYLNVYASPVVLGQVQSYNDPRPSVFWSRGRRTSVEPSSSDLYTGKHVGQDPERDRAMEQVGYIVVEAGTGLLGSSSYESGVIPDNVRGLQNPWTLHPIGIAGPSLSGVAIQTAMASRREGSWAILGDISESGLSLRIDEDQRGDSERDHSTEAVAYWVFNECPPGSDGQACSSGVCSPSGECVDCLDNAGCDDGNDCTLDSCVSNACQTSNLLGDECGAGDSVCDGEGGCALISTCALGASGPGILEGDLIIDEADTAGDLASIGDKWCVAGSLTVEGTSLSDLQALQQLVAVGWTLDIRDNESLESLTGLESLVRATKLILFYNDQLASLEGLAGLRSLSSAQLYGNPALADLRGLEGIKSVSNMEIVNNGGLTSLHGLDQLELAHSYISIRSNANLGSFDGLNALISVGNFLRLFDNDSITDLSGFDSLASIGGDLELYYNATLSSISGLLSLSSVGSLEFVDNPLLSDCQIEVLKDSLAVPCSNCSGNVGCGDGDACNGEEACDATGACLSGLPPDCEDGNECTADTCEASAGCLNAPVEAVPCDGGLCNSAGQCVACLDDVHCNDGNKCNGVESCQAGSCQGGSALSCDDGDPCTTDSCELASGCVFTIDDGDGDGVCDANDVCSGYDDALDGDGDGVADGCDPCPGDLQDDSDGDGSCDSGDLCPGYDDTLDADGDGIPDDCEAPNPADCYAGASGRGILNVNSYVIDGADAAADIAALQEFWCVSGHVAVGVSELENLQGLEGLIAIGGDLRIGSAKSSNPSLIALDGLENLVQIGGALRIENLPALTDVSALNSLGSVANLRLSELPQLARVSFLQAFESFPGWIHLGNVGLSDLNDFSNLQTVAGMLDFDSLDGITDASGLEALTDVGTSLRFTGCGSLASLQGLSNLRSVGSLGLSTLPQLTDIQALSSLDSIAWTLAVLDTGLTDLDALAQLQGELGLALNIRWNSKLSSITGLAGITGVQSSLAVQDNPALLSLDGLQSITTVGTGLTISHNDSLTSLDGLESVIGVGQNLEISRNANLRSIAALGALENVGGTISVAEDSLPNLVGLGNVTSVGGSIGVFAEGIVSLEGFPPVTTVPGAVDLSCPGVSDLAPLAALEHAGALWLRRMNSLLDLQALSALTSLGSLVVDQSLLLKDLRGLSGISELNELNLRGTALRSLDGLENLDSVGSVWITTNHALMDISALGGLGSANFLDISRNRNLPQCAIDALELAVGTPCENCDGNTGLGGCDGTPAPPVECVAGASGPTVFQGSHTLDSIWGVEPLIGVECMLGNLSVHGEGLFNLGGLQSLRTLRGSLGIEFARDLISTEGLDRLETVSESVYVYSNPVLAEMPLPALTSLGTDLPAEQQQWALSIEGNPNLSQCFTEALEVQTGLACRCSLNGPSCE